MSLIGLPSLSGRRKDISLLALHFTSRANQAHQLAAALAQHGGNSHAQRIASR